MTENKDTTPEAPAQAVPRHSQLPWKAYKPEGSNGYWQVDGALGENDFVATCYDKQVAGANAALIARAVNCHDELVGALKHITALHVKAECLGHDAAGGRDRKLLHDTEFCSGCHALAALAKAEGSAA